MAVLKRDVIVGQPSKGLFINAIMLNAMAAASRFAVEQKASISAAGRPAAPVAIRPIPVHIQHASDGCGFRRKATSSLATLRLRSFSWSCLQIPPTTVCSIHAQMSLSFETLQTHSRRRMIICSAVGMVPFLVLNGHSMLLKRNGATGLMIRVGEQEGDAFPKGEINSTDDPRHIEAQADHAGCTGPEADRCTYTVGGAFRGIGEQSARRSKRMPCNNAAWRRELNKIGENLGDRVIGNSHAECECE